MTDLAARLQPVSAITVRRETLTKDLDKKKASLSALQRDVNSAEGVDKNRLLWMVKNEAAEVEQAQKNLDLFENPLVLPHLKLTRVTVAFHPDNTAFDATVWVNNDGILPALGSFELDLSVSYIVDYTQGPYLYRNDVFPKTTPDSTDVQPGGTNPFVYPDIPFVPDPSGKSPLYTFDVLLFAGPGGVVADQNMHVQFLLRPPRIPVPIVSVSPVFEQ